MTPGATLGGTHTGQTRARRGAHLRRAWGLSGPPGPPLLPLPLNIFSLPKKHGHKSLTHVFLYSCSQFSISLRSPSFQLIFGTFDLPYVTPPIIQVEF